jgi:hypothetical protein
MLMTRPRVLTSMMWLDNVVLGLSHSMVKISEECLFENKKDKLFDGHIAYQSHMSISMHKPSTYACLSPFEFCQIVEILSSNFSCLHDRDHVHPHIHANSYTGSRDEIGRNRSGKPQYCFHFHILIRKRNRNREGRKRKRKRTYGISETN